MSKLFDIARNAKVYDLSQPLFPGMPHFPTHSPFVATLNKLHGDFVWSNGGSSAVETMTLAGHSGTHIDALNHFSCGGRLYGGCEVRQSVQSGVEPHAVENIAPILRRAVLLDIAGLEGVEALAVDATVTPEHLEAALAGASLVVHPGDIVLLRTGWARFWNNHHRYVTGGGMKHVCGPGPEIAAARWMSQKKIFAAGSDTMAFEKMPSPEMAVHLHLLFESGIHIIENLNLEELARNRVYEFLFIAEPLRIRGGTGSPIRPIAMTGA
jgi:kynurenine formamidase